MMRRVLKPLWFVLALVFLFEAWLWSHLKPVVAWIVGLVAWRQVRAKVASWIEHLPPVATLLVFLVPVILLLPIKLIGFWFLARGWWGSAMVTLIGAKIVSTGVTAFIFDVTRPKLLQLGWFRWLYDHALVWLARAHAIVDPIKVRIKAWSAVTLAAVKRRLRSLSWLMRSERRGRFLRRLMRIRRRAQRV